MKKKFTVIWEDSHAVHKTFFEADDISQVENHELIRDSHCCPYFFEGYICDIVETFDPDKVITI